MANEQLGSFMVSQLAAAGIKVTNPNTSGPNFKAYCFRGHDSKTPSLSIRKSDGAFFCFGCQVQGRSWEALKRYIQIEGIPEDMLPDAFEMLNDDLARLVTDDGENIELPRGIQPWRGTWRGLSTELLRNIDARFWNQEKKRKRPDPMVISTRRILFPLWQLGVLRAYLSRRLDKSDYQRYYNMPGIRAKELLYPLDFVGKMLAQKKGQTVVLVEGPYDALRLIDCGIPALALLGTGNYDDSNRNLLLNVGANKVVIALDGNKAGQKARYEIAPSLREWFDVEHFFTPLGYDPGDMPEKAVRKLQRLC